MNWGKLRGRRCRTGCAVTPSSVAPLLGFGQRADQRSAFQAVPALCLARRSAVFAALWAAVPV